MFPWDPVELLLREPTTSVFGSDEYKQSLLALSEDVIGWRVLRQGLDPQRFLTSFSPSMNLFFIPTYFFIPRQLKGDKNIHLHGRQ